MPKSGTTQGAILRRRGRNGKTARLSRLFRRFGIVAGGIGLVSLLAAGAVFSGFTGRASDHAFGAFDRMAARAGFAVRNVMVEGRINADPALLLDLIGMRQGDPILAFDPAAVRQRLEHVPWIRRASVERRLPDTIYVLLEERRPLALWQNVGRLSLIDSDGVTLTGERLERFRDLMLVVGEGAPAHAASLFALLQGEPSIGRRVEAATFAGDRRWDLKLDNGVIVRLPERDAGLALTRLAAAQAKARLLDRGYVAIDLRDGDRIVVEARPGAAQDYTADARPGNDI